MGIEYSSVIDSSREEVFAWHTRPGAIRRLLPPWQPLTVVSEAGRSLTGAPCWACPAGCRWVADHQPDAYDPPARFVDRLGRDGLASLAGRTCPSWRHEHTSNPSTNSAPASPTASTPRSPRNCRADVSVPAPAARRGPRGHRWSHTQGVRPGTVAISGASGLIGTALSAFLSTGGYRVIRLVRRTARCADERRWDPRSPARDLFEGVDAVVHLAGASIAGRFTDAHKAAIRDSRLEPTRRLADCAAHTATAPTCSCAHPRSGSTATSAATNHSTRTRLPAVDSSPRWSADWEVATEPAQAGGLRVVAVRTGIVQTPRGGTLQLLDPLFSAGLGGRLGSGRQWLSWIDLDDLLDVYHRALADPAISGPVNAVAPEPVRNEEYTRVLAAVLHRPALLPVPDFGPNCCSATRVPVNSPRPTSTWCRDDCSMAGTRRSNLEDCLRHQLGRMEASS